ncbi:MAG TPA: 2Fe-2S iron-sulfur cluster-binding protein [Vicinamibacteria bacterium]|jgi:NADH-quinone oxidoreductase subunit G
MPKCTIDGKEIEVKPGTTVLQAALDNGIHIQHFCWHPDLPVDGNCRTCMIEVEKMPKLQIACNMVVSEGMVVRTASPKAHEAQRTALEFLLVNHPIDCPVCDQAGECYLQDNYMRYGLYGSKIELEEKVHKRKVVDLGPIMLDAERCVLCSRCLRFEDVVTGTNSLQFVSRGDHTSISTFDGGKIEHDYAGNLADVCPVGALLSKDFRFKMRVWFLKEHESVCPGCSTGCNVYVDERDDEVQRLRARRNPDVNKSWLCDPGRALYKQIGVTERVSGARVRGAGGWAGTTVAAALDRVAAALKEAGSASAFLATPQGTNEDVFAFRALAEAVGGTLDFRVGDPQLKVQQKLDNVLQHVDRNPNTQGCLDQGVGKDGVDTILAACRAGSLKALVLQGPELLRVPEAVDAIAKVPFVAVMATHEGPELDRATVVLPAAMWAEVSGTFTNFQRRVQRLTAAVPPPGDAQPRFELAAGLLSRLGKPLGAASAREVFALVAKATPGYAGLDYRGIGAQGAAIGAASAAPAAGEARA